MKTGTIKFFNEEKGYGFINKDDGGDIFFHVTDCEIQTESIQKDAPVSFLTEPGNKGDKAVDVALIS